MRRAALAIVSTITGLVMLLSFKTHTVSVATAPTTVVNSGSGSGSSTASSAARAANASGAAAARTLTGSVVDTQYGPVQVRVVVKKGRIVRAQAIQYPLGSPQDQQINSYAIPALNREALGATSANLDMISGATYTSQGYLSSLQSALDKAAL